MELTLGGKILELTAQVLGARVTSTTRTPADNERVGGSPVSKHLTGDAIDLSADAPIAAVNALKLLAKGGWHEKGTAPHWHFEADARTVATFAGALFLLVAAVKK